MSMEICPICQDEATPWEEVPGGNACINCSFDRFSEPGTSAPMNHPAASGAGGGDE